MEPKISLFSRARPGNPTTKKIRGFFALPGEIRNQIYQYCFQDGFRCEIVGKGCQFTSIKPKTVKLWSGAMQLKHHPRDYWGKSKNSRPLTVRITGRLGRYNIVQGLRTCWLDSLCALILVCKQIHTETLPLFYRRTTFVFEAPHRIINFFRVVPQQNLVNVTKLHLYYTTYGNPSSACDVVWQEKHVESWTRACKVTSKRLTYLRELEFEIWINDNAPKFNLRQRWLQPLLQFRRLTQNNGNAPSDQKHHTLETVAIKLRSRLWTSRFAMNSQLAIACKTLHRLFGRGISRAILGAKEEEAMAEFNNAWNGDYKMWQHHLGFARTGW
jgi:hypothetical protein